MKQKQSPRRAGVSAAAWFYSQSFNGRIEPATSVLDVEAHVENAQRGYWPRNCVVVERHLGTSTHARSTADVLNGDDLTVTPLDGGVDTVYAAGSWRIATTYDSQGHPLVTHRAVTPAWTMQR